MHFCTNDDILALMQLYKLHVPVRAHVFKYLSWHLGHPYQVCENDFIGSTIIQMMRRPQIRRDYKKYIEKYPEKWQILMSHTTVHNRGAADLGAKNVVSINNAVDDVMTREMCMLVDRMNRAGFEKNQSILNWMADYQITESDLSFDAWKKRYQRFQIYQAKKIKNNTAQFVPS